VLKLFRAVDWKQAKEEMAVFVQSNVIFNSLTNTNF
jgi:hypothetical protein